MTMAWDTETTNQSAGGGDRSVPSAENHLAVTIGLVDLGHHDNTYNNQTSVLRKILFLWEIMDEEKPDGGPFVMDMEVSWMPKLGKRSALRKMLEGWRGKPYDEGERPNLPALVGKPCLLNIGHGQSQGDNTFAKILGISPPMRGTQIPAPTLSTFLWDLKDNGTDVRFPEWLKGRYMPIYKCSIEDYIRSSYEGRGLPIPPSNPARGQAKPQYAGAPSDENGPAF
jgi:hypothetical protein